MGMTDGIFNEMNRAVRTGQAITRIAKIEIKKNNTFKQGVINEIVEKNNLQPISRYEIDVQKALLKDREYQYLRNLMLHYCDKIEAGDDTEDTKNNLLIIIEKKEKYENIIRLQVKKEINR